MTSVPLICLLIAQSTAPADSTMDWLLEKGAPASQPTTQESPSAGASPFVERIVAGERKGTITLSDGTVLPGVVSSTPGKPLRLWDEANKRYIDLAMESIASMEAIVLWEREEAEWRFKESGHDEKLYTGKTYPARETEYRITLANGEKRVGGIVAPVYVRADGKTTPLVLHKRDKGEIGKTLKDLVYIQKITLDEARQLAE